MLDDNRRERVATRARAYAGNVKTRQITFETPGDYQKWRQTARRVAREVFRERSFLVWITGNHLGVLPVYDELAARKKQPLVIQLDSHLDIYNLSDCKREPSHGNYLRHCAGPLPPIINVGSREILLNANYVKQYFRHVLSASDLAIDEANALRQVSAAAQAADAVFVDIDCDAFDPAFFPAITHPQPFGLTPHQVLRVLDAAWSGRVMGLAISEFDPSRDQNDRALTLLMWLLEYVLLKRYESKT